MTTAYKECYLNDASRNLGAAFDYALNTWKLDIDFFQFAFSSSPLIAQFERGNPSVVSGRSGIELVRDIIYEIDKNAKFPTPAIILNRTPEYWAGYYLAKYQWAYCRRFKDIFSRIKLSEIISMYPLYHEMDVTRFYEEMERRYKEASKETNLARIRKNFLLSQSELARLSNVNLRSIQLYEQRVNDIDKAEAHTLFKLAVVLKCNIEDLLESPASI